MSSKKRHGCPLAVLGQLFPDLARERRSLPTFVASLAMDDTVPGDLTYVYIDSHRLRLTRSGDRLECFEIALRWRLLLDWCRPYGISPALATILALKPRLRERLRRFPCPLRRKLDAINKPEVRRKFTKLLGEVLPDRFPPREFRT